MGKPTCYDPSLYEYRLGCFQYMLKNVVKITFKNISHLKYSVYGEAYYEDEPDEDDGLSADSVLPVRTTTDEPPTTTTAELTTTTEETTTEQTTTEQPTTTTTKRNSEIDRLREKQAAKAKKQAERKERKKAEKIAEKENKKQERETNITSNIFYYSA